MFFRLLAVSFFCFLYASASLPEETFVLLNGTTHESILQWGPHMHERISPCSSFKIVLSLMGFDAGILKDEQNPIWEFQDGYDDYLETWKLPQTPQSWMAYSCIWYSQLIAQQLGQEKFKHYLEIFDYGNQDASGGLKGAWICSSLKISPIEQAAFILRMLQGKLSISRKALEFTKIISLKEDLANGWKLYGKTGWSGTVKEEGNLQWSWFVGWIEKNGNTFPFAYQIRDKKINLKQRVPRVLQLLTESGIMDLC